MVSAPSWLRRGKTPDGRLLTLKQRKLLRETIKLADETGWVGKSSEYMAELVGVHRTMILRQLRSLEASRIHPLFMDLS
jgi:hypothetical protein